MTDVFAGKSAAEMRAITTTAAQNPEPGMGFHEMYSFWTFVTDVTEHTVQIVRGGGHPSWFPECGRAQVVPRDEFVATVRHETLSPWRYDIDQWAARAEGLQVAELERLIRDGKRPPRKRAAT